VLHLFCGFAAPHERLHGTRELLREPRVLGPEMALRPSRRFGNSAEFRLNAQRAVDLWDPIIWEARAEVYVP